MKTICSLGMWLRKEAKGQTCVPALSDASNNHYQIASMVHLSGYFSVACMVTTIYGRLAV